MLFEIAVRTAQHMPPGGEAAHDQAGIRRRRHPDCDIKALLDDVDGALSHAQVDLHVGIGREEFSHHRPDELHNMGRGINPQRAARRRLQGAGDVVGLLDIGKDLDGAVVIGPAHLGQADLPRGAVEQPRAEPVLQRLDMVAHHRRRHVEPASGRGKSAAIRHPDEGRQTGQPIHRQRLRLSALTG